jgi:hypothetical protein
MELKAIKVCRHTFHITLTDAEARYLVEQHDERGSEHFPINHSFCSDRSCVSCKIVRAVKGELK